MILSCAYKVNAWNHGYITVSVRPYAYISIFTVHRNAFACHLFFPRGCPQNAFLILFILCLACFIVGPLEERSLNFVVTHTVLRKHHMFHRSDGFRVNIGDAWFLVRFVTFPRQKKKQFSGQHLKDAILKFKGHVLVTSSNMFRFDFGQVLTKVFRKISRKKHS